MNRNYLGVEDVLGIHQDSVDAIGGSHGIRDRGGLESKVDIMLASSPRPVRYGNHFR